MGCGASLGPPGLGPHDIGHDFASAVELGTRLGSDTGLRLHRGLQKGCGDECLVKIRSKTEVGTFSHLLGQDAPAMSASNLAKIIKREMAVLKNLQHPSLSNWIGAYEDGECFYLVTEFLPGPDLWDRVCKSDARLPELQIVRSVSQIVEAVSYLHDRTVCHRDLRLENVLTNLASGADLFDVKLTGFHFATYFKADKMLKTVCGTPIYVAPQVLTSNYNHLCDMWSVGVMAYILVAGYPPFFADSDAEILAKVRLGTFGFNRACWESYSEEAKTLCRMCFRMNPALRATAEDAKKHVETVWKTSVST